jgi:cytochrome c
LAPPAAPQQRAEGGENAGQTAYGRHLARECTGCHRIDGIDNGIPAILGWPPDAFIATMKSYRTGERANPVMVSVARSLNDGQLRALASYFASLPGAAAKPPAGRAR